MQRDEEESPRATDEGLLESKAVSRREFLKYAGIAGAVVGVGGGLGGLIAACGGTTTTTTTGGGGTTVSAGPQPPAADKIRIGAARPISGVNALFEQAHFGPAYKLWVQDVNAAGGLNVAGKKLPIEMTVYDDQSDLDTSMRLLTKLMEEDKVDFVFAPTSTAFLFAAAGVANAHSYILMSAEGGATTLEAEMKKGKLPWFFQVPELLQPRPDARHGGHHEGTGRDDLLDHVHRRPARHRVSGAGAGLLRRRGR